MKKENREKKEIKRREDEEEKEEIKKMRGDEKKGRMEKKGRIWKERAEKEGERKNEVTLVILCPSRPCTSVGFLFTTVVASPCWP